MPRETALALRETALAARRGGASWAGLWKRALATIYDDKGRFRCGVPCRGPRRSLVSVLGSPSPGDSEALRAGHPSAGQLEATAFGQLAEDEARAIRAHAAACAICGPALRRDESVFVRLALLRGDEPTVHVLDRVLDRLDHAVPHRPTAKAVRPALVILTVVLGALVLTSAARWREVRWRWSRTRRGVLSAARTGRDVLSAAAVDSLRRRRRAERRRLTSRR